MVCAGSGSRSKLEAFQESRVCLVQCDTKHQFMHVATDLKRTFEDGDIGTSGLGNEDERIHQMRRGATSACQGPGRAGTGRARGGVPGGDAGRRSGPAGAGASGGRAAAADEAPAIDRQQVMRRQPAVRPPQSRQPRTFPLDRRQQLRHRCRRDAQLVPERRDEVRAAAARERLAAVLSPDLIDAIEELVEERVRDELEALEVNGASPWLSVDKRTASEYGALGLFITQPIGGAARDRTHRDAARYV